MTPTTTGTGKRPFGMRDKIGYMFGDFGNDFTFILQSAFFMLFYTNVVGINPAHVGLLLLAARVLDGFTDVGMGILVDRLPVKLGTPKFKRWIKFIAVPVALASALMYLNFVADFDSYAAKVVWMCATYMLWGSLAYTAINIPYGAMASVVSDNPDHRAELSVFRSTGATLANLLIMSVLPLFVYVSNSAGVSVLSGPRMTIAAAVCAVLAVGCYALCYRMVEERVESRAGKEGQAPGIGRMLKTIFSNRALLALIVAALFLLLSMLFLGQMIGYLTLSYFGNGKLSSPASLLGIAPALVLIWAGPALSRRFGKAETGAVAMLAGGILFVLAFFLKIENAALWIGFYAVGMFAISVFNYLVWAFITDVIDFQEVRTGARDDGTVYAVYSWARKLGQALAGGLTGWSLGLIGFDATAAKQGLAQSAEVNDGIYMLTNLIPGLGCLLVGAVLLFLYPLKKKVVEENTRILRQRRAEDATEK